MVWCLAGWALVPLGLLAGIGLLNLRFYLFMARTRGLFFSGAVVPMHVAYFLYCGIGFAVGACQHYGACARAVLQHKSRLRLPRSLPHEQPAGPTERRKAA